MEPGLEGGGGGGEGCGGNGAKSFLCSVEFECLFNRKSLPSGKTYRPSSANNSSQFSVLPRMTSLYFDYSA